MLNRQRIIPWLTLGACLVPAIIVACSSNDAAPPQPQPDGEFDANYDASTDTSEDLNSAPYDANMASCTLSGGNDPIGLCLQKTAILGLHGQLEGDAGLPSYWSVATNEPAEDGGVPLHDYRDDIGYGAALGEYFAAASVYGDTDIIDLVSLDIGAIAKVVEAELATPPADYDGLTYLRLRRFAEGLRLTNWPADAFAIDTIAAAYGKQLYTRYYHPLGPVAVTSTTDAGDAGGDAAGEDSGAAEDAGTTAEDAGVASDGILGVPSGSGYAYDSDKAAQGALALLDMAARALTNTVNPAPLPEDAGSDDAGPDAPFDFDAADAAPPPDTADSILWANAGLSVFAHLDARARDSVTGLYHGSLVTSATGASDTVADDGSLTSDVQGGVALALLRANAYATSLSEIDSNAILARAQALLNAVQGTTPSMWDPANTDVTSRACAAAQAQAPEDAGGLCGSGFFQSLSGSALVSNKTIRGNAFLFGALHLASAQSYKADLVPLRGLFMTTLSEGADTFFSQLVPQTDFLRIVGENFDFEPANDAGVSDPLSHFYSAAATLDAIEGMDVQWVGVPQAPPIFQ